MVWKNRGIQPLGSAKSPIMFDMKYFHLTDNHNYDALYTKYIFNLLNCVKVQSKSLSDHTAVKTSDIQKCNVADSDLCILMSIITPISKQRVSVAPPMEQWRRKMIGNNETQRTTPARAARSPTGKRLMASVAGLVLLLGAGGVVYAQSAASDSPRPQAAERQQPNIGAPGFADLVAQVKPAVVSVRVKVDTGAQKTASLDEEMEQFKGTPFEQFFREFSERQGRNGQHFGQNQNNNPPHQFAQALGSGFFISPDGYLVTNNHVVEKAVKVQIVMDDGTEHDAKVIGTDAKTDIALLKVDGSKDFPYVKLASGDSRIGDWVVAMGNPFGLGGTVTAGIVSAQGRDIGSGPYDDYIQIDAPVNKGNSGGPTFNLKGEVIGVNTAIFSPSGGSVGIAFDIPAPTVQNVVAQLKASGHVERGWLGVQIQPVTAEVADSLNLPEAKGALITEPQPDSPAAKAGLRSGDVITRVDGKPVKDSRDLAKQIGAIAPNSSVALTVVRDGAERTVDLKLGQMQDETVKKASLEDDNADKALGSLGIQVAPASQVAGAGDSGLAVVGVDPNGKAAELGLREGDVILKSAGKTISSAAELKQSLAQAKASGKKNALVLIKRNTNEIFVTVPVAG